MDLDDEELEATRKLNGVAKSNIEEDIKNIEKYIILVLDKGYCDCNELNVISTGKYCDGSRNVAYSMQNILSEREQDKARIKELEEALLKVKNKNVELFIHYKNSVPAQKVKDVLTEIQKEYNKVQEQFDCIWNKKSKDDYDRYKLQELSAMQQQLGFFIGKLEELLEESK